MAMSGIVSDEAVERRSQRDGKAPPPRHALQALLYDFETEFFDDGIGEDFLGDALSLRLSVLTGEAVEIEDEEFALADVFDGVVAEAGEGVLDGLTLRIENGALWHDPNVCFHEAIIAKWPASESRPYNTLHAKAWVKLAWRREVSSDSERPMRWALRYSAARSVWNMVGSSVESVTGMPWRRSRGSGGDLIEA